MSSRPCFNSLITFTLVFSGVWELLNRRLVVFALLPLYLILLYRSNNDNTEAKHNTAPEHDLLLMPAGTSTRSLGKCQNLLRRPACRGHGWERLGGLGSVSHGISPVFISLSKVMDPCGHLGKVLNPYPGFKVIIGSGKGDWGIYSAARDLDVHLRVIDP